MKIEKNDTISLCPWQLTLDNGQTVHLQSKAQAEDYRDYLKEISNEASS